MLIACGVWLMGLGLYFIFIRPALLPEDPRYMGTTLVQVQAAVPGLSHWLRRVFTVLGGFMVATGVLTSWAALQLRTVRGHRLIAVLALAGISGVGLMAATNFVLGSDFRWLLLVPALTWFAAIACLAASPRAQDMRA